MASAVPAVRRVATYERVSSDDQRRRETIGTQTEQLARRLEREPDVLHVMRYADDGVSGAIPLADRPAGRRLMADARRRLFDELWVYKIDRLGRDSADLIGVHRTLRRLGIKVISVLEGEQASLAYGVMSVVADNNRTDWLLVSFYSTNRRAEAGGYLGGPIPYGYRVEGEKVSARLVPDDTIVWGELTGADVIRRIYRAVGLEGRTCPSVATELNALGIPTQEALPGRGRRQQGTQRVWRGGRIRQLIVNPLYVGRKQFGVNQKQRRWLDCPPRERIEGPVPPLVSEKLWQAAQVTLQANRRIARNTTRHYLLKGVIRCGCCDLTYVGSQGRPGVTWYRCGGRQRDRGLLEGRCPGALIRGEEIEDAVWADIERFLRNPGELLADLADELGSESEAAVAQAELITLQGAIEGLGKQRERVLDLAIRGHLKDAEVDRELERIQTEGALLAARLEALGTSPTPTLDASTTDLLDEVRRRLDAGLTDEQRQEVVRLLVKITIRTNIDGSGRPASMRAVVEYAFPGVVQTVTDRGSSRRRT